MKLPRADRQRARLESDVHSNAEGGRGTQSRDAASGARDIEPGSRWAFPARYARLVRLLANSRRCMWEDALQEPDQDACAAASSGSMAMTSG